MSVSRTVMVLDDEPGPRTDLTLWLQRRGFVVHRASSVDDAKRVVMAERIDYAIVDLKIDFRSETGGIQVVHFLKRNQPRAKAIILSAHDFSDEIQADLGNECDAFVSKGAPENYIRAVLAKIEQLGATPNKRTCFVIMPLSKTRSCRSDEWSEVFDQMIRPAVHGAADDLECVRAGSLTGNIIEDVLDNLNRADLVIADLTDRNPNVFYELGVRHALRSGTILITQRITDLPFDLKPYATIEYGWKTTEQRQAFAARLRLVLADLENDPRRGESPVLKYLGKPRS